MKTHNLIGKITLEEKVNAVKSVNYPRALVIDIPGPLASYYARFTDVQKPNSIVLVTKNINSFEKILRTTKNVNTKHNLKLEGAKCEVKIGSKKYNGIRLKGVNRYTHIDQVIDYYTDEGYNFNTNLKLKNEELALIRVNKFFNVEEVDNSVYRSTTNKDEYFFKMKNHLEWNDFKEKTKNVKHNIDASGFDIAQGILYRDGGIDDMVRVVKSSLSLSLVKEIEEKYKK
jgi:hypothetical protein